MKRKRFHILMYTSTFFPTIGGAEYVVHYLSEELIRRGHEVSILAPKDGKDGTSPKGSYEVHRYAKPSSQRFGVRQVLASLFVRKIRKPFDILHCHNVYPPGYVAATFRKFSKIPVLVTPHGTDIMASERLRQNKRLDRRVRKALESADRISAISRSIRDEILACGVPESKIDLIPNGVDLKSWRKAQHKNGPVRPYLLALGGFRRRKGFDVAIEAFAALAPDYPNFDLVIAGDGIEAKPLREQAKQSGFQDRILFPGNVTGDDKVRLFQQSEFFICPSRWEEPFGLINLEAMAAGKTVVASAVGGIKDVVRHGENGLLVSPDNTNALSGAIRQLLDDSQLRQRLETEAQKTVSFYDWPLIAVKYEKTYEELAGVLHA